MINEEEIKTTDLKPEEHIQDSIETTEPSMTFLNDWFGLTTSDKMSLDNQDKVRYIYDFMKDKLKTTEQFPMYLYLRDVSYKLGAPPMGMGKLQHIYQYIKLQNQRQILELKEQELRGI